LRRFALLVVLLAWLAALGTAAANRQSILDWLRMRGYQPSPAIAQLAEQDGMKDYTRHMFYLNRPQLLSTVTAFRQHCPENKDTVVLGCYHSGQNGIFVYDVPDPTLAGVQQVTAAHEVLHAIYARLSDSDKNDLNRQLEDFYKHGLTDKRVLDEVKLYQKTEPHDVLDEMSCTFGTEVAKLPPGLEAYYARYFSNRAKIVAYEQQYESEFSKRQALIASYDAQLSALKSRIDAAESDLNSKLAAINAKQAELNSERSSNVSAYNAGVPAYNGLVDAYNTELNSTRGLIDQYNGLVVTRNKVAGQLTALAKALDTRLTPAAPR
jgi:hypothetical protein